MVVRGIWRSPSAHLVLQALRRLRHSARPYTPPAGCKVAILSATVAASWHVVGLPVLGQQPGAADSFYVAFWLYDTVRAQLHAHQVPVLVAMLPEAEAAWHLGGAQAVLAMLPPGSGSAIPWQG